MYKYIVYTTYTEEYKHIRESINLLLHSCIYAGATVTIVSSDYMVNESQSSVEVCANLTGIPGGGLECEVVATMNTNDGPKASMSPVHTSVCHFCLDISGKYCNEMIFLKKLLI